MENAIKDSSDDLLRYVEDNLSLDNSKSEKSTILGKRTNEER
jgi:hypothetical protein